MAPTRTDRRIALQINEPRFEGFLSIRACLIPCPFRPRDSA